MSVTQQTLAVGLAWPQRVRCDAVAWRLQGSDYVWAIAFAVPALVFSPSSSIRSVTGSGWAASPSFTPTVRRPPLPDRRVQHGDIRRRRGEPEDAPGIPPVRFFMRKSWWTKSLLLMFILPWAMPALPAYISIHWLMNGQWGMLNNILYLLFGIDGPVYLNDRWMGLASNVGAYIWKTLPFGRSYCWPAGWPSRRSFSRQRRWMAQPA